MLEMTRFNTYSAPLTSCFLLNLENKAFYCLYSTGMKPAVTWSVTVVLIMTMKIENHIKQYSKLLELHNIITVKGSWV